MNKLSSLPKLGIIGIISIIGLIKIQDIAQAADFKPPIWRNDPNLNTTVQEWEFDTPPNQVPQGGLVPDGELDDNDGGNSTANPGNGITGGGPQGGERWWGTTQGAGSITFNIPNIPDDEPDKLVWIQATVGNNDTFGITNRSAIKEGVPESQISISDPSINRIRNPLGLDEDRFDFYLARLRISPNPDSERFDLSLPPQTRLYQVVVDTVSTQIPEPGTVFGLLAISGLGLSLKRKNQ